MINDYAQERYVGTMIVFRLKSMNLNFWLDLIVYYISRNKYLKCITKMKHYKI